MKKVFILFSIFNIFLLQAQDKVVTKNGKEVEVNKDASATEKGIVKLAGDLGGTADAPTVPGLATKQNLLTNPITGTGTVNFISKFNGATTLTNSQLFDNGTNIGIGTTTPLARFQIEGSTSGSSGASGSGSLVWLKQNGVWGMNAPYTLWVDGYSYLNGFRINGGDGQRSVYNQLSNTELGFGTNGGDITFSFNSGLTRGLVFKNNNGFLGLGTTTPNARLEVSSGTTGLSGLRFTNLTNSTTGSTNFSGLLGVNSSGDVGIGSISGASLSGFTSGQVPFGNPTGGLSQSSDLFWDQTNNRLGIGLSNPNSKFEIINSSLFNGTETATHGFQLSSGKTTTDYTLYMGADKTNANSYLQSVRWGTAMAPLVLNARGGNVGVGTPTPTTNLDVVGGMSLRNVVGAAGSNFGIEFNTNSSSPRIDWVYNGSYTGSFAGDADFFFRLHNSRLGSGGFRFTTNPSGTSVERLTILNNGNIGISNTNPTQRLTITGTNNQPASSGTTSNATVRIDGSTNHALDIGAYANSPFGSYVQSVDKSNLATALPLNLNPVAGNVGIGTSNPTSRLEVNGSATNSVAFNSGVATAILFMNSNLAYTSASATAFSLQGMKDGGTYTLAVQGTTSGTASFFGTNPAGASFTFRTINNGPTISGKQTLYTFIVMGTTVYVYMATGF